VVDVVTGAVKGAGEAIHVVADLSEGTPHKVVAGGKPHQCHKTG